MPKAHLQKSLQARLSQPTVRQARALSTPSVPAPAPAPALPHGHANVHRSMGCLSGLCLSPVLCAFRSGLVSMPRVAAARLGWLRATVGNHGRGSKSHGEDGGWPCVPIGGGWEEGGSIQYVKVLLVWSGVSHGVLRRMGKGREEWRGGEVVCCESG